MIEFISDLLATKIVLYLIIAYNIGFLIHLGIDILKGDKKKWKKR